MIEISITSTGQWILLIVFFAAKFALIITVLSLYFSQPAAI